MWFWWFMFVCNLIIPAILIFIGRMMWKHCPKKINDIYGYRTRRSKRNMETWKFAHDYCGRLWWKWGWILLIISSVAHFPFIHIIYFLSVTNLCNMIRLLLIRL